MVGESSDVVRFGLSPALRSNEDSLSKKCL